MDFNAAFPILSNYNNADNYCGCTNSTYPGAWGLSWTIDASKGLPKEFNPNNEALHKIHEWCDNKFNDNLFLWPDVFAEKDSAIEFKKTFLNQLDNIHLVSAYIKYTYAEEIIKYGESVNPKENFGEPGLQQILKKKIAETEEGKFIGFDMARIQYGSHYHSFFSCYNLGQHYKEKFGTQFNKYRLITKEEDIEKIVNYTNDEFWGESDLWLPVKIKVHNIK